MAEKIGNNIVVCHYFGILKKIILSFLLCFFGIFQAQVNVSLHLTDANGNKLEAAQVNVPFVLEVVVSGNGEALPSPKVLGLDQFELRGSSSSSSTFINNGVKTNTKEFSINLCAGKEGSYSIGPAEIEVDGQVQKSTTLTFVVGEEQKVSTNQDEQVFTEISFDKEQVYYGEPVTFTLRFFHSNNKIRLGRVQEPEFKNFTAKKLEGPRSGTRTVNGNVYRYLEWSGTLYPKKVGTISVPAVQAEYTIPVKQQGGFGVFAGMSQLFGGMQKQQVAHSNSIALLVIPLPEHIPPVQAVGDFSRVTFNTNNTTAGEGEGIVAFFDVFGEGNLEQLDHPPLVLPKELTSYESHAQVSVVGDEHKKSFEYVIQGRSPGDYTIEAQKFTYFNVETESYKTITTKPVHITIDGLGQLLEAIEKDDSLAVQEEPLSILEVGAWKEVRLRELSWFWFFLLMFVPLLLWLVLFIKKRRHEYLVRHAPQLRYNNAFKQAYKQFGQAKAGNYDGQLYHMFIELFAARLKMPRSHISEAKIEQVLRDADISEADIVQWRLLFAHFAEQAFSSHRVRNKQDTLFNKAAGWLRKLETIL